LTNSLLVAVSQANTEPWLTIWREGQEKTWLKSEVENVDVIHFKSKSTPIVVQVMDRFHEKNRYKKRFGLWQGRIDKVITRVISHKIPKYSFSYEDCLLTVNSWSTYQLQGRRFIALYDWFLSKTDYKFLFTTTTSSYIIKKNLSNLIQKFDSRDLIYAGYLLPENQNKQFVSGAGTLLSRKCIESIVENWHKFKFDTLEDVSHGDLMRELRVTPIPLSRIELTSPESVAELSSSVLSEEFHFRCKSPAVPREDVQIMTQLHLKLDDL
jgi:hypothetical protein